MSLSHQFLSTSLSSAFRVITFCFMSRFYSPLLQGSFPWEPNNFITWIRNLSQFCVFFFFFFFFAMMGLHCCCTPAPPGNSSRLPFKFKHLVIWRQNTLSRASFKFVQLAHRMKSICWEDCFLQLLFIFKALNKIWPVYLESTSKFHLPTQKLCWKLFLLEFTEF